MKTRILTCLFAFLAVIGGAAVSAGIGGGNTIGGLPSFIPGDFTVGGDFVANTIDTTGALSEGGVAVLNQTESDTAYVDVAGDTMTGTLTMSSTFPRVLLHETDASANNAKSDIINNAETVSFRVLNDSLSVATTYLLVTRTGTTVNAVNVANGTLQAGGNDVWHGGNLLGCRPVHDFPSISADSVATQSLTCAGVAGVSNEQCTVSVVATVNINFSCYANGANSILMIAKNSTSGAINPASLTFNVVVQTL